MIDGSVASTATGTMTIDGRVLPATGLAGAFSNTTQALHFQDFLGPLIVGSEEISLGRMLLVYPNDGLGTFGERLLVAPIKAVDSKSVHQDVRHHVFVSDGRQNFW